MKSYYVVPIKETEIVKFACIRARTEKGALQKFYNIFKVKGGIHRFEKIKWKK